LLMKTWKNLLIIGPIFFIQCCQTAQNQHISHILIHKNGSLRDFYVMTLLGSNCSNQILCLIPFALMLPWLCKLMQIVKQHCLEEIWKLCGWIMLESQKQLIKLDDINLLFSFLMKIVSKKYSMYDVCICF
jgi:hypothetical protein